jgi:chromosome segregation ATPase
MEESKPFMASGPDLSGSGLPDLSGSELPEFEQDYTTFQQQGASTILLENYSQENTKKVNLINQEVQQKAALKVEEGKLLSKQQEEGQKTQEIETLQSSFNTINSDYTTIKENSKSKQAKLDGLEEEQAKIDKADASLQLLISAENLKKEEYVQKDASYNTVKIELDTNAGQLKSLEDTIKSLTTDTDRLNLLKANKRTLTTTVEEETKTLEDKKTQLAKVTVDLSNNPVTLQKLKADYEAAKGILRDLSGVETTYKTLLNDLNILKGEIKEQTEQRDKLILDISGARSAQLDAEAKNTEVTAKKDELAALESALVILKETQKTSTGTLTLRRSDISGAELKLRNAEDAKVSAKNRLDTMDGLIQDKATKQGSLIGLNNSKIQYRIDISGAETKIAKLEGQIRELKATAATDTATQRARDTLQGQIDAKYKEVKDAETIQSNAVAKLTAKDKEVTEAKEAKDAATTTLEEKNAIVKGVEDLQAKIRGLVAKIADLSGTIIEAKRVLAENEEFEPYVKNKRDYEEIYTTALSNTYAPLLADQKTLIILTNQLKTATTAQVTTINTQINTLITDLRTKFDSFIAAVLNLPKMTLDLMQRSPLQG